MQIQLAVRKTEISGTSRNPSPRTAKPSLKVSRQREFHRHLFSNRALPSTRDPCTLGSQRGQGVVQARNTGSERSGGTRVAWSTARGSYANVRVPASALVRLPDNISFEQGAAVMLQGMTTTLPDALHLCFTRGTDLFSTRRGGGRRADDVSACEDCKGESDWNSFHRGKGATGPPTPRSSDMMLTQKQLRSGVNISRTIRAWMSWPDFVGHTAFGKAWIACVREGCWLETFGQSSSP